MKEINFAKLVMNRMRCLGSDVMIQDGVGRK